jgi:hypothetical protein
MEKQSGVKNGKNYGNTWFTHCDKYGGVFSIAVGSLRGVVLDLNELEEFENATYN